MVIKSRLWRRPNSIREEIKLRKISEIERLETDIKKMKKSKTEMIRDKSFKLLDDLNMEKGLEIESIKKIEIKLKNLKIPKRIVNKIRKLVIPEKYLYHILRHKKYFA